MGGPEGRAQHRHASGFVSEEGYLSRRVLQKIPLRADPLTPWLPKVQAALLFLLCLSAVLVCLRLFIPDAFSPGARWPEAVFLVIATAGVLAAMTRQLPGQNVILASAIVAVIGSGVQIVGVATGIPFGPF